ncbi:MAG TPA: hypothetical protein DDW52_23160 [Planctomycetaceae bacterium]|nr:hypothetical protein [Planctomycetaceae bacterium]
MKNRRNHLLFGVGALLLSGCVASQTGKDYHPFETVEIDSCLTILIDMSGSFATRWDDEAYPLFLELSETYFTEAMGTENRLVIAQLSGNNQAVLFEGKPADLQSRFRSPEDLVSFLRERSDGASSQVYRAIKSTTDYLLQMQGVSERTRLMTVVLSDLRDTGAGAARRTAGSSMIESLREYRERGGALALYYVGTEEMPRWESILAESGFSSNDYLIQGELTATPQLPKFD